MPDAFSDLASLHSAIVAIALGRERPWTTWHMQSVIELTHLLLQDNVRVLPGLRGGGGAHELQQIVSNYFRELEFEPARRDIAKRKTLSWTEEAKNEIADSWENLRADKNYEGWLAIQREYFWTSHVKRHRALFDEEFIPTLAVLLKVEEKDLHEVHVLSSRLPKVEEWQKTGLAEPEAQLADQAWVLSGLIRGKYYDFLGSNEQLLIHPFRRFLPSDIKGQETIPISNTEAYLIQVIIGSALNETGREGDRIRVDTWASNINKAKNHIPRVKGVLNLPDFDLSEDGAERARQLARKAGIVATSKAFEKGLNRFVSLIPKTLLSLTVQFWPAKVAIGEAYKETGIDERIVKAATTRDWQYRQLAELAAGKLQYDYRLTLTTGKSNKRIKA